MITLICLLCRFHCDSLLNITTEARTHQRNWSTGDTLCCSETAFIVVHQLEGFGALCSSQAPRALLFFSPAGSGLLVIWMPQRFSAAGWSGMGGGFLHPPLLLGGWLRQKFESPPMWPTGTEREDEYVFVCDKYKSVDYTWLLSLRPCWTAVTGAFLCPVLPKSSCSIWLRQRCLAVVQACKANNYLNNGLIISL